MTDERISDERYSEEERKAAWGFLYRAFGEIPVPEGEQWKIAACFLRLRASHAELMKALEIARMYAWPNATEEHRNIMDGTLEAAKKVAG